MITHLVDYRALVVAMIATSALTGCTAIHGIEAIPASRLPIEVLARKKEDAQQISISRLRQNQPLAYQLGPDDILGIYIEDVLGEAGTNPPVHFAEEGNRPPALGFPVPIREDGTIQLPYIEALPISGLTLTQATDAIRTAYVEGRVLQPNKTKIVVTLIQRRKIRVTVIREEAGGTDGVTKRGTGRTVDLPAYENDVLHALNETGGLPGLDANNELLVIKSDHQDGAERDQLVSAIMSCKQPCECPPLIPDAKGVTRIPFRFYPEAPPTFTEEDITLQEGDIIYIGARDTEKFYTGGLLPGGEHLLPRDYSVDVLEAIALAGGTVASGGTGIGQMGGGGSGNRGGGGSTGCGPSDLIVLRKLPCGGQIAIKIDLNKALNDPSQRILVQPGDTLVLRYKLSEEIGNAALSLVRFNVLFNGFSGGGF